MTAQRDIRKASLLSDYGALATIEDMIVTRGYETTIAAGSTPIIPIFTAPFPMRIMGVTGVNFGGALTLDGSNYWSFRPRRYRVVSNFSADYVDIIGSSGTNFTISSNKLQGEPWPFEPQATYDDTYRLFRTGDVLAIRIASSGSPTSLSQLSFTVRYEPQ